MRIPSLAVVVAPNGAGHLARALRVVSALLAERRYLVTIAAAPTAKARWLRLAADDPTLRRLAEVEWIPCYSAPLWSLDLAEIVASIQQIDLEPARPSIERADLVISDNSALPLEIRSDVTLQGSFLWSEMCHRAAWLQANETVQRFVRQEFELLVTHQPSMLCTLDLATPWVEQHTRAVDVGWLCPTATFERPGPRDEPVIGVSPGLTAVARAEAIGIVDNLQAAGVAVAATERLVASLGAEQRRRLVAVLHENAGHREVDVMLCRPGATTLTECVAAGIPIGTFHEPDSPEMTHNSRRIHDLGLGRAVTARTAADVVAGMVRPQFQNEYRRLLHQRRRNGLADTTYWLSRLLDAA